MEFDGFYNLMNHRKVVHPSTKSVETFPQIVSLETNVTTNNTLIFAEIKNANQDILNVAKMEINVNLSRRKCVHIDMRILKQRKT